MKDENSQIAGGINHSAAQGEPPPPASEAIDRAGQDSRWPYPQGSQAADEKAGDRVINVATAFIAESKNIRRIQQIFLVGVFLLIAALTLLLFSVVETGFKTHITATEEILVKTIESSKGSSTFPKKISEPKVKQPAPSVESPPLHTLISTGVTAVTSATVAIFSILVIAISVITIAVARAAFSLAPQRPDGSPKANEDPESKPDSGYAIPGLEFAKEIVKMVTDLVKGGTANK